MVQVLLEYISYRMLLKSYSNVVLMVVANLFKMQVL
jgi:hypothetical protein